MHALVDVFIPQFVDLLVRDNFPGTTVEWPEAIKCFWLGNFAAASWSLGQRPAHELRDSLANGFLVTAGPLTRGLKYVVLDIKSGAHTSDANTSRLTGGRCKCPELRLKYGLTALTWLFRPPELRGQQREWLPSVLQRQRVKFAATVAARSHAGERAQA